MGDVAAPTSEAGQDHPVVRNLRRAQERGSIFRLSREYGLDQLVRGAKVLVGLIHLTEIALGADALHSRYLEIRLAELQRQPRIPMYICGQAPQVIQRSVHNQLPRLGAAGQLARLSIDVN